MEARALMPRNRLVTWIALALAGLALAAVLLGAGPRRAAGPPAPATGDPGVSQPADPPEGAGEGADPADAAAAGGAGDPAEPPAAAGPANGAEDPAPMQTPAANLLGVVPILMYHHIGRPDGTWTRTPENFRADLERLYAEGYRPVALADYLQGCIDLPAGTHPVILTFDDSSPGQFRYLVGPDGEPRIDPESAVGILLEFAREHQDFLPRATFFVNFPNPFGQPLWAARKLGELVELGMELGNHTYSHANLRNLDAAAGVQELARAQAAVRRVLPDYALVSVALPYGALPRDEQYLLSGGEGPGAYHHLGVLLVGAQPAPSPLDPRFDPRRVPRIRADGEHLGRWLGDLARRPERRFTSDGAACPAGR